MVHCVLLAAALAQAAPPSAEDLPFRFELLRLSDRIESDGRSERRLEARINLRSPAGVAAFGQIGLPYLDGYHEVSFADVRIERATGAASR